MKPAVRPVLNAALASSIVSTAAWAGLQSLTNPNIYTGKADAPWAGAVVIEHGVFSLVGGATVIPGLLERDFHPRSRGEARLFQCKLDGDNHPSSEQFLLQADA